jgi:hypothetical protein
MELMTTLIMLMRITKNILFIILFLIYIASSVGSHHIYADSKQEIIRLKRQIKKKKSELVKYDEYLSASEKNKLKRDIRRFNAKLKKLKKGELESGDRKKKTGEEKTSIHSESVNSQPTGKKGGTISEIKEKISDIEETIEEETGIEFGGFFDVNATAYEDDPNTFAIGDFELDIEKSVGSNFQIGSALVFNDEGSELAVGFIDFHLFGGNISPRGRLFEDEGLHLQIGKYDIPFGNDWRYYASVDRLSVSAPSTTENVMDGGYNDIGMRMLGNFVSINFNFYVLRGIKEGNSFGGRMGFTPFNNPYTLKTKKVQLFEIGASYMYDIGRSGEMEENAAAIDIESKISPVGLIAENSIRENVIDNLVRDGYHLTLYLDFNDLFDWPFILYSRYDFFKSQIEGDYEILAIPVKNGKLNKENEKLQRINAGVQINLYDICFYKFEYLHSLKNEYHLSNNQMFMQLVITF